MLPNRRSSNGEQVNRIATLVMAHKPSVDFSGYWQRHIHSQPFGLFAVLYDLAACLGVKPDQGVHRGLVFFHASKMGATGRERRIHL